MTASIDIGGGPSGFPSGWNPGGMTSAAPQERKAWMRETNGRRRITLSSLRDGMPGLTPAWGGVMAEAASVCLESQGHSVRVELSTDGALEETVILKRLSVTPQMLLSHHDEEEATEHGACGVAILTVRVLLNLIVVRRSRKGTGFDYWLNSDEDSLFQQGERLEVSGIRKGPEATIKARISEKIRQIQRFRGGSPVLIAVVEFSRPLLRLVKVSRPSLRIMKP